MDLRRFQPKRDISSCKGLVGDIGDLSKMMLALAPSIAAKSMGLLRPTMVVWKACSLHRAEQDEGQQPLSVLSHILKPRDEMGRAFSHAPDSSDDTARRRALEIASGAESSILCC